jgi:hypothetical protein
MGQPAPAGLSSQRRADWYEVISVFDTFEGAAQMARRRPKLGSFIAILDVPDDAPITRKGGPGHFDLRGKPEQFLALIVDVVPI